MMNSPLKIQSMHRPYIHNVVAGYRTFDGCEFDIDLGECFSEFSNGPHMQQLANYVAYLTGAKAVWLKKSQYVRFQ